MTEHRAKRFEAIIHRALIILALFCFVVPALPVEAAEKLSRRERKERIAALDEKYLEFLDEVDPIISPAELDVFLKMESDPQRERFIEEFWRRRDPDPVTARNEYRDAYYARRQLAVEKYRSVNTDRGRVLLLRGQPGDIVEVEHCRYLKPVEVWLFSQQRRQELILFYRPGGDYVLWRGTRASSTSTSGSDFHAALEELLNPTGLSAGVDKVFFSYFRAGRFEEPLIKSCIGGSAVLEAIHYTHARGSDVDQVFRPPEIDDEDVRRMLQTSVVSDPDAPAIEADSSVTFGGSRGSRTLVRLLSQIAKSSLEPVQIDGRRFYQINAVGETLKNGEMFERWQYRFDFPESDDSDLLPVVVERPLRKGIWQIRMKLHDPQSGGEVIVAKTVDVPAPDDVAGLSEESDESGEQFRAPSRSVIRLSPPGDGILTGYQTFLAIPAGDEVAGVEFYLDGTRIMRKMQPPYSLELDLGPVPRPHTVRAVALNRRRVPVDEDVLQINLGTDPFRMRIVSPRIGRNVAGPVRIEMEPEIPSDEKLTHVELYLNDDRVAILYEEPWMHTVFLPPGPQLSVLRAVAVLDNASIRPAEDVVILNGPENLERVDVRLIEVPTTVFADGHPIRDLTVDAFQIRDGGNLIDIAKFERLSNQPLSIGIAIDSSASMKERLSGARHAASNFLERVLTPKDRAFLLSFDRRVFLLTDWTSDPEVVAEGLASLRAEEATALYDAVIESLYRFVGLEGQRALILISDGSDTASRFEWKPTLEYARRMAIPIYSIGIGISVAQVEARSRLQALAESTGGRSWFVADVNELAEPYQKIEQELRSQYLLGFYMPEDVPAGSDWREISVEVQGAGEVRALPGYYP